MNEAYQGSVEAWVVSYDGDAPVAVCRLWIADPRLGKDWLIRKDLPNSSHDASNEDIQEHAHVFRRVKGKGKGKRLEGRPGKWKETHAIRKDGSVSHSGRTKKKSGDPIPKVVADVLRDHDWKIPKGNVIRLVAFGDLGEVVDEVIERHASNAEWLIVIVETDLHERRDSAL